MSNDQLQQLPSVSKVLLEVKSDTQLHVNYITAIIQGEIRRYRQEAKAGQLKLKRREIVQSILDKIES